MNHSLNVNCRHWIFCLALIIGLFSGNVSQAAMSNTYTWIGGTNTNATNSAFYSNTVGTMAQFSFSGSVNAFVYPGTNTQTGTQIFNFGGTTNSIMAYGWTFTNWSGDIILTNLADWRVDSGGLAITNGTGTSTLWIMGSNAVGQLGGDSTFSGNYSVYVTGLGGHSTSARKLTQNLTNLVISNLTVNAWTTNATIPSFTYLS